MEGIVDSFGDTVLAFSESGTHDGYTTVFQDGLHIGKVQIHRTTHGDYLGDTLCSDGKRIIGLAESIHEGKVGIYFAQALVVDDQQGIYVLGDTFDAVQCLNNFLFSFENKWNGDNTYCQNIHLLRNAGDDRGGSGSGSSSHSGSDEYHLGAVVQLFFDIVNTFFGGVACPFGTVAGSKSLCDATAQLQFHRNG